MKDCKVNILGTEYRITVLKESECPALKNANGFMDSSVKQIVVDDFSCCLNDPTRKAGLDSFQKKVIRHEIIHAFLAESGLEGNGLTVESWADNEEMVDWFAIQSPKIYKVFAELDIL